jgi:RNA polymerase sigma-70 factor (ECF subfamily)
MTAGALDRWFRSASARVVGALASRYRDLDLAEEAFAEACLRAARAWRTAVPDQPDAWLYVAAQRCAFDMLRKRRVREGNAPIALDVRSDEELLDESTLIPDERLRLIFVCCHPAIAADARVALTLRVVCGLSTAEIAHAFLVSEATLAQRLVRAKRKIAEARIPFEVPGPRLWSERLDAVLSTMEVAYAKAHEDAAGTGAHAAYAAQMLELTQILAELLPEEADVLAFAALVRFAEARRPARLDATGCMIPLSAQDPAAWDRGLIEQGHAYLKRAFAFGSPTARLLHAAIHAAWCTRESLAEPAPWEKVLSLYDGLLELKDDPITRLNRIVALAEVAGVNAALTELDRQSEAALGCFLPYHAVRADLLRRSGRSREARREYNRALALGPPLAEADWLRRRRDSQATT